MSGRVPRATAPDSRPPQPLRWAVGLLGLAVPLLWKPVAHSLVVLLHGSVADTPRFLIGIGLGALGFVLVAIGLRRDELTGTCFGFAGGALIWIGWFETGFEFFGQFLAIPRVAFLTPNLLLMEASAALLLGSLVFLAMNKDTRCRMFLWFHRNLRLRPNKPTPGYRRQYARIAAMEMVFVSWFFYVLIIALLDPRILGPSHPVTYAVSALIFFWGVYLVALKVPQQQSMANAIRYGIPTTGVIWYSFEVTSAWQWYVEPWVRPLEFPVTAGSIAVAFVTVFALAAGSAQRGAPASP